MTRPRIDVGLQMMPAPPIMTTRALIYLARLSRLQSFVVPDHFQGFFPAVLWDRQLTWVARRRPNPDQYFDYQVVMGYLARSAGRLQLGTAVTEPIRRHPVLIAQTFMTLSHITRKPPILGIGSGERENIEPYGLDFRAATSRLEEALQIIRRCFSESGPIDFNGRHFQLRHALMELQPARNRMPEIWVAAHGPRALRLAGRYGDGWYPSVIVSPEDYAEKLEVVRAAARAAGRDPSRITPALETRIIVAPTEQEAWSRLTTKVVRFVGLLAPADVWRKYGAEHPFGPSYRGYVDFIPNRFSRQEYERALELVPIDALADALVWGTPEQVIAKLRAYGDAGVRHIIVQPLGALASPRAALDLFASLRTIAAALRNGSRQPARSTPNAPVGVP